MSGKPGFRPIPTLRSDEETELFVEEADLSQYDLTQFKPVRFAFDRKTSRNDTRVLAPHRLRDAIPGDPTEPKPD